MDHSITLGVYSDNSILLNGITKLVATLDRYDITCACTSESGIEECTSKDGLPDLFLLNVDITDAAWVDVIGTIKQRSSDTKVLIMSKYNNKYNIVKALRYGANGYVDMGCSLQELHKALLSVYYTDIYYNQDFIGKWMTPTDKECLEALAQITNLEKKALTLFASELSYKEIASELNVSAEFVEAYKQLLFEKFNVKSRVGLVVWAHAIGELKVVSSYTT